MKLHFFAQRGLRIEGAKLYGTGVEGGQACIYLFIASCFLNDSGQRERRVTLKKIWVASDESETNILSTLTNEEIIGLQKEVLDTFVKREGFFDE